jgi:hypothetical protein
MNCDRWQCQDDAGWISDDTKEPCSAYKNQNDYCDDGGHNPNAPGELKTAMDACLSSCNNCPDTPDGISVSSSGQSEETCEDRFTSVSFSTSVAQVWPFACLYVLLGALVVYL